MGFFGSKLKEARTSDTRCHISLDSICTRCPAQATPRDVVQEVVAGGCGGGERECLLVGPGFPWGR